MSKAILVMDMPENCADCNLTCDDSAGLFCIPADMYFDGNDSTEEKPSWCPLRELPEKKPDKKLSKLVFEVLELNIGWNACLDAIEGSEQHE